MESSSRICTVLRLLLLQQHQRFLLGHPLDHIEQVWQLVRFQNDWGSSALFTSDWSERLTVVHARCHGLVDLTLPRVPR